MSHLNIHQHAKSNLRSNSSYSWGQFFALSLVIIICSIGLSYLFSTYLPILFESIFLSLWGAYRIKKFKPQHRLNQLEIPENIKTRFLEIYPQLDHEQIRIIEAGWKDFLALHLHSKTAYVMPSQAVDALWHVLIKEFNPYYQQMCRSILGYVLNHKEHKSKPNKHQKRLYQAQMMMTWKEVCLLEQRDPQKTDQLPRIFQIDQQLKWKGVQQYEVKRLKHAYTKWIKHKQHHSGAYSSSLSFTESSVIANLSSSSISSSGVLNHDHSSDSSPLSDSSISCGSCSSD